MMAAVDNQPTPEQIRQGQQAHQQAQVQNRKNVSPSNTTNKRGSGK